MRSAKGATDKKRLRDAALRLCIYVGHSKSFDVCYETINLVTNCIANSFQTTVVSKQ